MPITFYEGPSAIDGTPVLGLLTGYDRPSTNEKTGPMLQTWIVVRGTSPVEAVKSGEDSAVCGQCPLRGDGFKGRSCYVRIDTAVQSVWRHTKNPDMVAARAACRGKRVRLGAYGNPSALPYETWRKLLKYADGWTGYDHNWRDCDPRFQRLCMASVESEHDARVAQTLGWRTFRVARPDGVRTTNEVLCPASAEAGRRTTCHACMLCAGTQNSAKNVMIPVHGSIGKVRAFEVAAPCPTS